MRNRIVATTLCLVLLGCLSETGIAQEQDSDEQLSDLIEAIQSRNVQIVEDLVTAHPELAAAHVGPDVPLLLVAVFSKDNDLFVRPEDNELVHILLPHIKEPGIFEACVTGNLKRARDLIEADPTLIDTAAASDWTPLHFAAYSGNVELARYLVEQGSNVNARAWKSSYIVPLLSGMLVTRYDMSRLLLDLGADPLVRERGGFSAMHEVANLGDTALIRLLYDRGAELNSRRDTGDRPIDLATKNGYVEAADLLKELGAEE